MCLCVLVDVYISISVQLLVRWFAVPDSYQLVGGGG